jgi:hypothetical protein
MISNTYEVLHRPGKAGELHERVLVLHLGSLERRHPRLHRIRLQPRRIHLPLMQDASAM